jgi:hypothetical protein
MPYAVAASSMTSEEDNTSSTSDDDYIVDNEHSSEGEGTDRMSSYASTCSDDDEEYIYMMSDHDVDEEHFLPSDIETTDADSSTEQDPDDGLHQKSLLDFHRESFYQSFMPYYNQVRSTTHLLDDKQYEHIKSIVLQPKQKGQTAIMYKYRKIYQLGSNVDGHCLYRNGKVVTTFEKIFDVILEAHKKIGHAADAEKNKKMYK